MKWKYFLRGLGCGIIFGAIVMLVGYMTVDIKMSDEDIKIRAKELGMVEQNSNILADNNSAEDETTAEESTDNEVTTEVNNESDATTEVKNEADTTDNNEADATYDNNEASDNTEADNNDDVDNNNESNDTTTEAGKKVTSTITVTSGMNSQSVAKLLQDAGIISDYMDFDTYLNQNGYSTKIRINEHTFTNEMTYEEIAAQLIKEKE